MAFKPVVIIHLGLPASRGIGFSACRWHWVDHGSCWARSCSRVRPRRQVPVAQIGAELAPQGVWIWSRTLAFAEPPMRHRGPRDACWGHPWVDWAAENVLWSCIYATGKDPSSSIDHSYRDHMASLMCAR